MIKQNKTKLIFSMRIASQLIKIGYPVIETLPNPANPQLIMWVFEETPSFKKDFERLLERRKE